MSKPEMPRMTRPLVTPMPIASDPSPEDYPAARDVVVLCAWCPGIHILRYHLEKLETLVVFVNDRKEASIYRAQGVDDYSQYKRLVVSHGICDTCRAANFPPAEAAPAATAETVKP